MFYIFLFFLFFFCCFALMRTGTLLKSECEVWNETKPKKKIKQKTKQNKKECGVQPNSNAPASQSSVPRLQLERETLSRLS